MKVAARRLVRTMLFIAPDPELYADRPGARLTAARRAGRFATRALRKRADGWPPASPGSINAWLLLISTKPPAWRDPIIQWRELPPALGDPHEGFFYPDPLGFWAEVRHWVTVIFHLADPAFSTAEGLALSAMLHVGEDRGRLDWARDLLRPRVVLFLDEPAWTAAELGVKATGHFVPDPHRPSQVYEGLWGRTDGGVVVGKSPQHPAAHRLYAQADMDGFLRSAPIPR